jgi:Tol biopolymer transport system component
VIGRRLSHYRIEERLGAGGMGEVYRARDEKLGRDVALKVLPSDALADEEARRRFRKEAAVLSRLSHPHIATLHDFDSAEGIDFLVMELVVGLTLDQELRKGPLPAKDVTRLGTQLARGLQAAHEQGVIHRDLKPSNLQLTSDGMLKILDFGVAHLERAAPREGEATATETGEVLGSPPYMSPEQVLGKGVDARTDLYAAGACLYELATGKRLYGDKRGALLTEAILHEAPVSPRTANGTLSLGLEAVILKCLDKDPELRYQTAKELLVDLERLHVSATSGGASQPVAVALAESDRRRRRRRMALAAAAILVVAAAASLWLLRSPRPPRITNARPLTGGMEGLVTDGGWATDGTRVYYLVQKASRSTVYQAPATGGEPAPVPVALPVAYNHFICGYLPRDSALLIAGSELSIPADTQKGPTLWTAPVPAGAPSRLGNLEAFFAGPSPDGAMVALSQRGARLLVVRRDGTLVREWPSLPSQPVRPAWSPDGRRLRFQAAGPDQRRQWVWEASITGGEPRALWPGDGGRWTPDGRYYVFDRRDEAEGRNDIYAAREATLAWLSPSQPVRLTFGPLSFTDVGSSPDGKHLFAWGTADRGELLRYDAKAGRFEKYLDGASVYYVDASRDGKWLTWVSFPDGALWRSRSDGSDRLKLTGSGWVVALPRWSPDGTSIVFAGRAPEERLRSIFRVSREGGVAELLARSQTRRGLWDPCWLPDGQAVLYSQSGFDTPEDFGIYRLDLRTRAASVLPGTERLMYPKCSPRGDILTMEQPPEGRAQALYWAFFVDRGRWERLGPMPIAYPNWSRDGQSFVGFNEATRRIERWSRATGRLEAVADVGDIPLLTWVVVPWMGLAPDGSPMVVRDRSTRDLYALDWEAP